MLCTIDSQDAFKEQNWSTETYILLAMVKEQATVKQENYIGVMLLILFHRLSNQILLYATVCPRWYTHEKLKIWTMFLFTLGWHNGSSVNGHILQAHRHLCPYPSPQSGQGPPRQHHVASRRVQHTPINAVPSQIALWNGKNDTPIYNDQPNSSLEGQRRHA